jgi:glycerol uptake facilitator-like aquaporin
MFIAEMIGTFSFVSVCCMAKNFNGSKETIINAFACGLALSFGIFIGGGISGGAINPSVGLVQSIFQSIVASNYPSHFGGMKIGLQGNLWVHVFGPATGGILAGIFNRIHGHVVEQFKASTAKISEE